MLHLDSYLKKMEVRRLRVSNSSLQAWKWTTVASFFVPLQSYPDGSVYYAHHRLRCNFVVEKPSENPGCGSLKIYYSQISDAENIMSLASSL
ncbi:hypothetical protein AVEN_270792-1 [Araneus ventricosus]|uniref:Uncharacterized protein n=1 Tax=Araneus ventricosus TaxID=182803 RepID=A0A4Y2HZK7_ARAVE|nr:hypothetical protein AVEN_270792-1 [Araneus ventricosus]